MDGIDIKKLNSEIFSYDYGVDNQEKIRLEVMLKMVGTGKKVLDVGCRDGTIAKLIEGLGNKVEGVEISEYSIKKAQEKGIKVYDCDLNGSWAEKVGSGYDLVFAGEVLEHVFETDSFLSNINRVLKPGGKLILSTPIMASLGRRFLLLFGKNPRTELTTRDGLAGHVRYFVYEPLKKIIEENGFKVIGFTSDVINFTNTGVPCSAKLAQIFPTFGRSLIFEAEKIREV